MQLLRDAGISDSRIVEINQIDNRAVFYLARSQLVQVRTPVAILGEIIGGALGKQNVAGIAAIHDSLSHVDTDPGNIRAVIYVHHSTNRTSVNAHPQFQARLGREGCTDLQGASNRRLRSIEEHQRHSIAGRKSDQFFLCLGLTKFSSTSDDMVQLVEQSPLFVDEQFRITDHVDEQNMSDVQFEMRSSFRGHVSRCARRGVQPCQTIEASRAETNDGRTLGMKAQLRWWLGRVKSRLKSNFWARWSGRLGWRIENLHEFLKNMNDGCFVSVESASELFFQCSQLFRKIPCTEEGGSHLNEGAYDKDAHLDRACTVQDIGCHDGTVFSKGPRQILTMRATFCL